MLLMLISHEEKKKDLLLYSNSRSLVFLGPSDELNVLNNTPPANAVQISLGVFLIIHI